MWQALLGNFDFTVFQSVSNKGTRVYGQVMFVLYTVFAAIVLSNLLIAIVTYKYKPEQIQQQSQFEQAKHLEHYSWMVDRSLVGSPVCLVQALLVLVPHVGRRSWVDGMLQVMKFFTHPMDGLFPGDESRTFPRGKDELPYLTYLLTLYVVTMALCFVLYAIFLPYSIIHFSLIGHRKLLDAWLQSPGAVAADAGGDGVGVGGSIKLQATKHRTLGIPLRLAMVLLMLLFAALAHALAILILTWINVYGSLAKLVFHTYWLLEGLVLYSHSAMGTLPETKDEGGPGYQWEPYMFDPMDIMRHVDDMDIVDGQDAGEMLKRVQDFQVRVHVLMWAS